MRRGQGAWLVAIALSLLLAACANPFVAPRPLTQRTLQISVLSSTGLVAFGPVAGQANVAFIFDSDPGSDERVSCNQTPLRQATENTGRIYFQGTLAAPPPGGQFACTYTGQGQTVAVTFGAAQPLLLTAPTPGSVITRQVPLSLTFTGGQPGASITVLGGTQKDAPPGVPPANALVQLVMQGSNTGSVTLPASALQTLRAGDGVLFVTQSYATPLAGTVFKSVQVSYTTQTAVAVTWT